MIEDWIYRTNLRPFLELVASFVEYHFIDDEWVAIEQGLQQTDTDRGLWYDYEFKGKELVTFSFGIEKGASEVSIKFGCERETSVKIAAIIAVFQTYFVARNAD